MTHPDDRKPRVRRREALAALGGLGLTGALGARFLRTDEAEAASCVLSPELTEGPYWVPNHLTRRDITEGRPGLQLELVLAVQNARTCKRIKGADVEVWHCDAKGVYSGVLGDEGHYLRGHQKSNAAGRVRFGTIYPGWYEGRTPHIHVKVHVSGDVVHTGQLFFSDRASASVYRRGTYRAHGQADTTNEDDMIYLEAGRTRSTLKIEQRGRGYRGSIVLGVAT